MRTNSLRQTANRYLKTDNRGSFKDKKTRAYVIHKLIDDLFVIGKAPPSWHVLTKEDVQQSVCHWQKQGLHAVTLMRYMTIIRQYFADIGLELSSIDNKSLGIYRQQTREKPKSLTADIWRQLKEPSGRIIMALQAEFGLTFAEAIQIRPAIHIDEREIWLTREVAFNSRDRAIPVRYDSQISVARQLSRFIGSYQSLVDKIGYETLCQQWQKELSQKRLPANKTYRYLYAQAIYRSLAPKLGSYRTRWLIRDEMSIHSRNTLWLYLNE